MDFSQNLATDTYDFDTLSLLSVYGGIRYEPLAYNVTDPDDTDAPIFDLENGYFDVTNKAFAAPLEIDLSYLGWGIDSFPACFLPNDFMGGSEPAGTCNPVELTIRQSFKKVPKDDYEPSHFSISELLSNPRASSLYGMPSLRPSARRSLLMRILAASSPGAWLRSCIRDCGDTPN